MYPNGVQIPMQTVAETSLFIRQAERLFDVEEKAAVIAFLASNPYAGDEIPGTAGVRKVRVAAHGRGKRGGARVIYYVFDENAPIFALLVYGKGDKTNLTADEKAAVRAISAAGVRRRRSEVGEFMVVPSVGGGC